MWSRRNFNLFNLCNSCNSNSNSSNSNSSPYNDTHPKLESCRWRVRVIPATDWHRAQRATMHRLSIRLVHHSNCFQCICSYITSNNSSSSNSNSSNECCITSLCNSSNSKLDNNQLSSTSESRTHSVGKRSSRSCEQPVLAPSTLSTSRLPFIERRSWDRKRDGDLKRQTWGTPLH